MNNQKLRRASKVIAIARVSTLDQGLDDRTSLPAQIKNMMEYLNKGGRDGNLKQLIGKPRELEESASQGKRKKFQAIMKEVKSFNEPVALLFESVDRLTRRYDEIIELEPLVKEGKVELHFAKMYMVIWQGSNPWEWGMFDQWVVNAKGEARILSYRVKRSIKERLERGLFPGYAPTGYLNKTITRTDGRTQRVIEIDEKRAPGIRKMFQLYATDRYSLNDIAKIMRNAGFTIKAKKRRNGDGKLEEANEKLITKSDVLVILRNRFYTGKFYHKNPETGEIELWPKEGLAKNYTPIISEELFEQVQSLLDSNNSRAEGYSKNNFKFRGLLKCYFCGCTLTPEEMSRSYKNKNSPGAKRVYYHCSSGKMLTDPNYYNNRFGTDHSGVYIAKKGKRKGQRIVACPQRWWTEEEIEEFILSEFEAMHYDDSVYEALRKILNDNYQERMEAAEKEIQTLRVKLDKTKGEISSLVKALASEKDSDLKEDMRIEYEKLKKKREEIMKELELLESARDFDTDETIDALKLCCDLKSYYLSLPLEKQRELLSLCFSEISMARGTYRINNGKGKKVKLDSLYPIYNEPFKTLTEINIEEIVNAEEDVKRTITKTKDFKASLIT